ncbi:hypothetical protein B0H14DRAFT_3683177 [Mycena olivaceomarginata]|nr:hypothetical protein B0H14DRAFT_3683177 [Mycena olivaceomarginata]
MPGVPVHQPSHLEGNASLATEILPAPPSLLSVVQQSTQKRDLTLYSYLHPTDPGHSTIIGQGRSVQNMKGKISTITGRARCASARNHNGAASTPGTSQGEAPVEVGGSSLSQPLLVASEALHCRELRGVYRGVMAPSGLAQSQMHPSHRLTEVPKFTIAALCFTIAALHFTCVGD